MSEDEGTDPDAPTEEEKKQDIADKMDPKSPEFIAPGNIYRCLAVCSPDRLGYIAWGKLAFKALIAAYMQVYIPSKIVRHTRDDWEVHGVKSPLWFLSNATIFLSMMAALLSLCNMFAARCSRHIMNGCGANFYILTHRHPLKGGAYSKLNVEGDAPARDPVEPSLFERSPNLARFNEYFWCCTSMVTNITMSIFLQLAMFLKVATFTGAIDHVAVVAVSLYFVFELDSKVLDGDPALRARYRRMVLKQTEEREYKPTWLCTLAMLADQFLQISVPFGLLAIVMCSWKNQHSGYVIGGDGLRG
jgi:hypothetical protein